MRCPTGLAVTKEVRDDIVILYYAGHAADDGNLGSHYLYTFNSRREHLSTKAIETQQLVRCYLREIITILKMSY
jgi:hypothetical protein